MAGEGDGSHDVWEIGEWPSCSGAKSAAGPQRRGPRPFGVYKLVVETPAPDTAADPSALTPHWEEWDGQIVRVWL